jgi:hypothetical protein
VCTAIRIGKPAVVTIIRELGYRKLCARWVPKMLTVELNTARKGALISRIITMMKPGIIITTH